MDLTKSGAFPTAKSYRVFTRQHPNCTCTLDSYDQCLNLHADCPDHGNSENQDNKVFRGNDLGGITGIYQRPCGCRWESKGDYQIGAPMILACAEHEWDRYAPPKPKATDTQVGGDHYSKMPIQPVDYIVKNNIPFREACVIKYVTRHRDKNGAEDIKKAIHFLNMILEEYEA